MSRFRYLSPCVVCLLLVGCSTTPSRYQVENDFIPTERPDPSQFIEPIPITELASRRGNSANYQVLGKRYKVQKMPIGSQQRGIASWYGMKFHGYETSNGEIYDVYRMTAAHKTLPLPSYVKVTRIDNDQSVVVRVNDRGPFHPGRIIDLSYSAAIKLGIDQAGTAEVVMEVLTQPLDPNSQQLQIAVLSNLANANKVQQRVSQLINRKWPVDVQVTNHVPQLYRILVGPITGDRELKETQNIIQGNTEFKPIILDAHVPVVSATN